MSRSSEYRGEPLKELEGKTHFVCGVTARRLSILSLEIHHIQPQASGIADVHARSNLLLVSSDAHKIVHKVASSMAGLSATKRPARELAEEYAHTVATPENVQVVVENVLKYASIVAAAISKKKNKLIEGGDVTINVDLTPRQNSMFKILAKTIKDGKGRPIGKERLTHMSILSFIGSKIPEVDREFKDYIQTTILKSGTPTVKPQPMNITPKRM